MNRVLKHIFCLVLPLVVFVLHTGCIKENLDGCERSIEFEYFADGNTDVFSQHITRISLYVFDKNDKMVSTADLGRENPIVIEQNELKEYQGAKFMLTGGIYRFVALGNANTEQATAVYNLNSGKMSEIICRHPDCTTSEVEGNDPLYLGSKVVEVPNDINFSTKIRLYSSHQKVSVTVKGYIGDEAQGTTRAATSSDLVLRLTNVSSELDFYQEDSAAADQNLASGALVTYCPLLALDKKSGWYEASFNILRHTVQSPMEVEIIERATSRTLCKVSLKEFLEEFYEVDATKQEAEIPIIVEFTTSVTVTIPSWMLQHRDPIYDNN